MLHDWWKNISPVLLKFCASISTSREKRQAASWYGWVWSTRYSCVLSLNRRNYLSSWDNFLSPPASYWLSSHILRSVHTKQIPAFVEFSDLVLRGGVTALGFSSSSVAEFFSSAQTSPYLFRYCALLVENVIRHFSWARPKAVSTSLIHLWTSGYIQCSCSCRDIDPYPFRRMIFVRTPTFLCEGVDGNSCIERSLAQETRIFLV